MKSVICDCGESRCYPRIFAGVVSLECARCGEPIKMGDPALVEVGLFIYNHSRQEIKEKFSDDKELLEWALDTKNIQEEEEYKRKIGMTGDRNVGT